MKHLLVRLDADKEPVRYDWTEGSVLTVRRAGGEEFGLIFLSRLGRYGVEIEFEEQVMVSVED